MRREFGFLLLFICLVSTYSCTDDAGSEDFINTGTLYEVTVNQALSEQGSSATLTIQSVFEEDCSNAVLSTNLSISPTNIYLNINGIVIEDNCIPGLSIPSSIENLGIDQGSKSISIVINETINNQGTLEATSDYISLKMNTLDGIKINKKKINRIKPGMIWGSFKTESITNTAAILDYFQSILNDKLLATGDYGYFYYSQDGITSIYKEHYMHTFAIYTDATIEEIEEFILTIHQKDPSLSLSVTTYKGASLDFQ